MQNVKESIKQEQRNARMAADQLAEGVARAWDEGFTACAHEHMAQEKDPAHPITRTNPYQTVHYMWEGKPISREDLQSRIDAMRAVMEEADENRRRVGYGG